MIENKRAEYLLPIICSKLLLEMLFGLMGTKAIFLFIKKDLFIVPYAINMNL